MASRDTSPLSSSGSQPHIDHGVLIPVAEATHTPNEPSKSATLSPSEHFAAAHGGLTPGAFLRHDISLDGVLTAAGIDNVSMPTPGLFTFDWFFERHKEYHATIKGTEDAGLAASVFSLFNGSVGASTLGVPLAMSLMGWGVGLFANVIIATASWLTSRMLVRVCAAKSCRSYDKAIELVLGSHALHVFQAFMVLSTMGSLIAYMIMIGDFAIMLLRGSDVAKTGSSQGVRQVAILFCAVIVVLPLSLMRRVTSLVFVSLLSVLFVFVLGIVLAIEASKASLLPSFEPVHTSVPNFFRGLPILVLAFSNQTSVMPVYREMKEALRTPRGFDVVCGVTNGLVFLLYSIVGISGYYLFGDRVAGNVLNSFTYTDVAVAVVAASYLFKILFTYPMSNYPLRVTLHYLYRGETVTTPRQHVLETLLPFAIALVVGLFVRDVGFLFSFTGAIARTAIVFLYPCALAWKCDYSALSKGEVNEVIALGCLGVLVMVLGVWSSIQSVS